MSKSNSQKAKEVAADNGIVNSSGAAIMGFAPLYVAFVPVTSFITKPSGPLQQGLEALLSLLPNAGGSQNTAYRTAIPALSALYIFIAFGATGAFSAAGQAMAREESLDSDHPRKHLHKMDGLPLRMMSAHTNLMENFSAFAISAALTQTLAPGNYQLINLLALNVLLKCGFYYGAYLLNIPPVRTFSHVIATSAMINVCWRLASGQY